MKEILLTSSVLILAVFLVRVLFRSAISRRVQYALWGLVLLRLLIPFQLPAMEHNVLTAAAPVQKAVEAEMEDRMVYALPTKVTPVDGLAEGEVRFSRTLHTNYRQLANGDQKAYSEYYSGGVVYENGQVTRYQFMWPLEELLRNVWIAGMIVMAFWFLISNLRFRSNLCKVRTPYIIEDCKYPVYLVEEGLPSPCLFGLFRPAIYLTPAAIRDEETIRHVLAHETTHARHLDPLWSFLRGVCLVIYWFDPLVWAAAFASRTDCELACDEGALKHLGESERIPYGRTLLSLIPVRKNPASPLLSATTMTADKKKLTERIKRIAENRQTVHAALFVVIAIAVMVCAMTFTGAKTEEDGVVPLTNAEVYWFNTEFFNGEYLDIQNQFLSSTYESPEEINMFDLFYCGAAVPAERSAGTTMSEAERKLLLDTHYEGMEPDCACEKIASADMDIVLLENTGLSLSDTQKVGLEDFYYLPKYGAYYFYHGDTNYRAQVVISYGEREGSLIRLYYEDTFMGGGWKCVTLRYQENAGLYQGSFDSTTGKKRVSLVSSAPAYHFVSNLPAEQPAGVTDPVQIVLPAGEPEARVKLDGLTVYGPQEVAVTKTDGASVRRVLGSSDYPQITMGAYTIVCWTEEETGITHFSYGRTDGNVGESTFYDFLVCPALEGGYEYQVEKFYNLLGHSGFAVTYLGGEDLEPKDPAQSGSSLYTVRRYYDFDGDSLKLLATTVGGDDQRADLDDDGSNELFFYSDYSRRLDPSYNFYFHRQGTTYALDLREIAFELFPDWSYVVTGGSENGCIPVTGAYQREDGAYVDAFRYMYFTGDELLFYKDSRETVDHVMGTPDVPADVLEMAKGEVEQLYTSGEFNSPGYDAGYDDWRIENLELDEVYSFTGGEIEVYNMNFEFHASKPENVMLAGGMYHSEEDWVMPSYPNCFYLYVVNENGTRRFLKTAMVNDGSPGVDWFDSEVYSMAAVEGLTTMADLEGISLLRSLSVNTVSFLEALSQATPEEQDRIASKICYYRTSGSEEEQALYQVTMTALVGWNTYELTTAQYDAWVLLFNYHVVKPAELTEKEQQAVLTAARSYMWEVGNSEACLDFYLYDVSIDSYQTWWAVEMYTDGAIAVRNGYSHDTMTHLTAVRAVYDISWDHTKTPADEEGRSARHLYMLPDENGEWFVWDQMTCAVPEFYEMTVESLVSDQKVILQMNGSGYITEMNDYWRLRVEDLPTDLTWTQVENTAEPAGNFLTIGNTEMGVYLRCWEENDLIQVNFLDEEAWYTAEPLQADAVFDGQMFTRLRQWFDEIEWSVMVDSIVVPDRGQSHEEVAREWAERYTETLLKVTSGSQYACTYAAVDHAELWDWIPETAFPAYTEGKERFCFGFSAVFVPETEKAMNYLMAGNTTEYEDGPEGAYTYSRVGYMHLEADGWHCDGGVGTGP